MTHTRGVREERVGRMYFPKWEKVKGCLRNLNNEKIHGLTLYAACVVLQCIYIDQLDAQILVINLQSLFL